MESPNPDDPVETAVFRSGWLLKKLFLASRQRASCEATYKWEWDPEHTCLYIGRLIRPGEFLMFTSDVGITSSFAMTAEDQEMILSAHYSKEAVGFFSDLLKLLLQDVPLTIREVTLSLQAPIKSTRLRQKGPDSSCETHHVFLVSSAKDKTKNWFIDPTGAQFGLRMPVHDADAYMKKWGNTVHTIAPSGTAKAQLTELATGEGSKEFILSILFRQNQGVATAVANAVQNWTKQIGLPVSVLRNSADCGYEEIAPRVLKAIDEYVTGYDKAAEMAAYQLLRAKEKEDFMARWDKAIETGEKPPDSYSTEETFDLEHKRILAKQAQDMREYEFKGTWA